MKLGELNEEIGKISMVKCHRAFVSPGKNKDTVDADIPVEIVDIYIKDEISLRQAIEELDSTCVLDHCYAAITNAGAEKIYLTDKGKERLIRYDSEHFSSLEELSEKKDILIHWNTIKEIKLSFNVGSLSMIFG
jgi:hypothetical protein